MNSSPGTVHFAAGTHVGHVRQRNEDSLTLSLVGRDSRVITSSVSGGQPDGQLDIRDSVLIAVVADGVGGQPDGDAASQLAAQRFPEIVYQRLAERHDETLGTEDLSAGLSAGELEAILFDSALAVHAEVGAAGEEPDRFRGMASTLTAWVATPAGAWLVQVGDSRCYRLRGGELRQLSVDQTLAQHLIDEGSVKNPDNIPPMYHNTLTSTVGGHESSPVVSSFDRADGDVILVCSDGIIKHLDDERVAHFMSAPMSPREMLDAMFQAVLTDGATDNLTAIVLREVA